MPAHTLAPLPPPGLSTATSVVCVVPPRSWHKQPFALGRRPQRSRQHKPDAAAPHKNHAEAAGTLRDGTAQHSDHELPRRQRVVYHGYRGPAFLWVCGNGLPRVTRPPNTAQVAPVTVTCAAQVPAPHVPHQRHVEEGGGGERERERRRRRGRGRRRGREGEEEKRNKEGGREGGRGRENRARTSEQERVHKGRALRARKVTESEEEAARCETGAGSAGRLAAATRSALVACTA